jgi:hypothetical protein
VNRIALHQSVAHPLDPAALVGMAHGAGLRVTPVPSVEQWRQAPRHPHAAAP